MVESRLRPAVFALVEPFLLAADRLAWFISLGCPQSILALSPNLVEDIDALVPDAATDTEPVSPVTKSSCVDIYEYPSLLQLVLSNDRLLGLQQRKVQLTSALQHGCDAYIVDIFLQQSDSISAIDRERSFALLVALRETQQSCKYSEEQISAWLDCFPSDRSPQTARIPSRRDEVDGSTKCVNTGGDSRRCELLNEQMQACQNNDLEMVDALLPAYCRSSAITDNDQQWHTRLLKLTIDRRHLRVVELLLRCDPRGRVIRIEELLSSLQPMSPRGNSNDSATGHRGEVQALVGVLTGEEPLYAGLVWNAAALEQAIDTNDQPLLSFLLDHIDLPLVALESAHVRANSTGNTVFAARLASAISSTEWKDCKSNTRQVGCEPCSYREGERVSVQYAGGVHFWTGTIHRCWLNGTYDVRITEHGEAPLETQVPSLALRPLSASKLDRVRRSVIAGLSQSTVERVVGKAAHGILENGKLNRARVDPDAFESEDDEGDEEEDSGDESDCNSDCSCESDSSNSSSNLDSDSDASSDSSGEEDPIHLSSGMDVPTVTASSDLQVDSLCVVPETYNGERNLCVDPATIQDLTPVAPIEINHGQDDNNLETCMATPEIATASMETLQPPLTFQEAESERPPDKSIRSDEAFTQGVETEPTLSTASSSPITSLSPPAVVSCAVAWTSSTVNLAQLSDLQDGDRVDVRFRGREPWRRGRISQCHGDKPAFDVAYDDGEYEEDVAREYIRLVTTEAADKIDASVESPVLPQGVVDSEAIDARNTSEVIVDTVAEDHPDDLRVPLLTEVPPDATTINSEAPGLTDAALIDKGAPPDSSSDCSSDNSRTAAASHEEETSLEQPMNAEPLAQQADSVNEAAHDKGIVKTEPGSGYRAGQAIEANFLGIGKFHPARIVHVHADEEAFDVAFSEFDQTETRVSPANIRLPRGSSRRIKSLLKGSSSSVVPIETIPALDPSAPGSLGDVGSRSSHMNDPPAPEPSKLDEVRRPINSPLVAPLSTPLTERPRTSCTSWANSSGSSSRSSLSRNSDSRASGRLRPSNRSVASSREVEEWRNVDIILNRKRRLLNAPTGNVETTKVPWGEEFASIQSLKRFAMQHPDVLRDHMRVVSQLSELGIQPKSPTRNPPSPPRLPSQTRLANARETLLMIKDLAFLLHQRLSPFFDDIVPVVLPAVFSSDRRFLCDTAYDVLEALVLHCSCRKLALVLLQQGAHFNTHEDFRLLNLTSVYVEKCFVNFSAAEMAALAASEPSKGSSATAQLLAQLFASKSIPTRIAIEKSLLHLQRELGERRFELFLRTNLESEKADSILLCDKFAIIRGASCAPSPTVKSPRKQQRGSERGGSSTTGGSLAACHSPSILQRMLQQRHGRVRPTPSHA